MSSTPIGVLQLGRHSQPSSPSNCHQCRPSQMEGQSSSEGSSSQSSQSISIHVNAKNLQSTAHKFSELQKEIKQLQSQNQLLLLKNEQLMNRLDPVKSSQRQLRRVLKEKEFEINQLKNQLSINNYGMSDLNYQSLVSKKHHCCQKNKERSRSKSHRKQSNQKQESSAESSVQQDFNFIEQKFLKREWETQKLTLEKQILQLEEKVLLYEDELRWSMSLAFKMIDLGEKLGFLFKEKVWDRKWSSKRQAKAAWRYLKHILAYMLQVQ